MCPQAGVELRESQAALLTAARGSNLTAEERDIMEMHQKTLNTKAMAGTEDCLHLAVHTPYVNQHF